MYVRISDKIQVHKSIIQNQSSIMYLVKSTAVASIISGNNNCNLKYHFYHTKVWQMNIWQIMSPVEKKQSKILIPVHWRGWHNVITQGDSLITILIAKKYY